MYGIVRKYRKVNSKLSLLVKSLILDHEYRTAYSTVRTVSVTSIIPVGIILDYSITIFLQNQPFLCSKLSYRTVRCQVRTKIVRHW